jgi:hypothetical protein
MNKKKIEKEKVGILTTFSTSTIQHPFDGQKIANHVCK